MKTDKIRDVFLSFFKDRNHQVFPSANLVPDDTTVLFTCAGMNQFKPYFLGEKKDLSKAVSCQKCLRTGDLENVGQTPYHHTFFEMLGNFSFGDYFKKEAIEFAWEFLGKCLNMKEKDLWISVYEQDRETSEIWKDYIGVSADKIVKLGQDSNFWPANAPAFGPNGPCGPCSEIFFDQGKGTGCKSANCSPACGCSRFVEVWNLVFTQFNRVGENKLDPLPQKNIDTGMGLERIASVLQHKKSNFEIDILYPLVNFTRELLGVKKVQPQTKEFLSAIVDHARAVTFAVSDGVFPSNEERGYVVRKLIRRSLWRASLLGYKLPFLWKLSSLCAEVMKEAYPDVYANKDNLSKIILSEEERFLNTLKEGREQVMVIVKEAKDKGKEVIDAKQCFRMYDTYGFPLELCREIAGKHDLEVDEKGFLILLEEQQARSRRSSMFDESIFKKEELNLSEETIFYGYDCLQGEGKIVGLIQYGREPEALHEKEEGLLVLDRTPFYPESGGQKSDKGNIKTKHGEFLVENVFKVNAAIVHQGRVITGEIVKEESFLSVDRGNRQSLARSHTATHLLQAALRDILGGHVTQQGSLVNTDKLRFDFTHFKAMSASQLRGVEDKVNEFILRADAVDKRESSYEEEKEKGALAFFKDKYSTRVRVVSIGDYSKELCAGTHLDNTSQVGLFSIVLESSVSSGVRRIEAEVGYQAYKSFSVLKGNLKELEETLKCGQDNLKLSVEKLIDDLKRQKDKLVGLEQRMIALKAEEIIKAKKIVNGEGVLIYTFSQEDYPVLLYLSDILRGKIDSVFMFFISAYLEKDIFVCSATDSFIKRNFTPKKFVSLFSKELSLKGGGRDHLVQGVILSKSADFQGKVEKCLKEFLSL